MGDGDEGRGAGFMVLFFGVCLGIMLAIATPYLWNELSTNLDKWGKARLAESAAEDKVRDESCGPGRVAIWNTGSKYICIVGERVK